MNQRDPRFVALQSLINRNISFAAALDQAYPRLSWRTLPQMTLRLFTLHYPFIGAIYIFMLVIVWPWITLASLMIFRVSLGRAKIKTAHVLRCVIYASDFATLMGVSFLLLSDIPTLFDILDAPLPFERYYMGVYGRVQRAAPLVLLIIVLVLTYRLAVAYRRYLRFPHAIATAIASQVIVVLAILNVLMGLKHLGL